jgi:hypothetical protein
LPVIDHSYDGIDQAVPPNRISSQNNIRIGNAVQFANNNIKNISAHLPPKISTSLEK